jgi:hypothetical protein
VICALEGLPAPRTVVRESGRACKENSWPATAALVIAFLQRDGDLELDTPERDAVTPSALLSKVPLVGVSAVMSLPRASVTVYWVHW